MRKLALLLFISLLIASCNKKENCCTNIEAFLDVSYIDSLGNDLLDTATQNSYVVNQMELFYKVGDTIEKVFFGNQDYPNNIMYIDESTPHRIRIFTNTDNQYFISEEGSVRKGKSEAYIKLSDTDTDTITAEWKSGDNYFVNTKIWYNGVEIGMGTICEIHK